MGGGSGKEASQTKLIEQFKHTIQANMTINDSQINNNNNYYITIILHSSTTIINISCLMILYNHNIIIQ